MPKQLEASPDDRKRSDSVGIQRGEREATEWQKPDSWQGQTPTQDLRELLQAKRAKSRGAATGSDISCMIP